MGLIKKKYELQKTHENKAKKKSSDGVIWRRVSYRCKKSEASVRNGPRFSKIKIPTKKIIQIIYEWGVETTIKRIKREFEVSWL